MRRLPRSIFTCVLALTLCALVGAANRLAADDAEQPGGDAARLQGTWTPVELNLGGIKVGQDEFATHNIEFKDGKISTQGASCTFKLDETKSPKHIDLVLPDGGAVYGIYQLDGDTLVLCLTYGGGERPKDFTAQEEGSLGTLKKLPAKE